MCTLLSYIIMYAEHKRFVNYDPIIIEKQESNHLKIGNKCGLVQKLICANWYKLGSLGL